MFFYNNIYIITKDDKSLYLSHNGILGQKWGKKNGPPYPLSAGDHSKAEVKAGYKKSIGGDANHDISGRNTKKINKINDKEKTIESTSSIKERYNGDIIKTYKEIYKQAADLANKLSPEQKKVVYKKANKAARKLYKENLKSLPKEQARAIANDTEVRNATLGFYYMDSLRQISHEELNKRR